MKKAMVKYRVYIAATLLLLTTRIGLGAFFVSASDITDGSVLSAVNNERTSRNIPALNTNSKLSSAALSKSEDMIARNYFSHVDPDGNYIWGKIAAAGYTPYTILGENLAVDFSSTEGLMAAWINSPTHRENILNENFRDQGIGIAHGDTDNSQFSIAVTNTFGTQPASTTTTRTSPAPTPTPTASTQPKPSPRPRPTVVAQTKPSPTPLPSLAPTPTAQTDSAPTPSPSPAQKNSDYPQFNSQTVQISTRSLNDRINLHIYAEVSGALQSATATIDGQSTNLASEGAGLSGDVILQKYFDFSRNSLVLSATSVTGQTTKTEIPLTSYAPPPSENPKNVYSVMGEQTAPDVYSVFSYVVIIFGFLFIVFAIVDTTKSMKKTAAGLLGRGSRVIIFLLLISTILLVNWWH